MPDEEIINTEEGTETPSTPADPPARTMLDDVKLALRLTTDAYNDELTNLINSGLADLGVAGVHKDVGTADALIKTAVITYCKIHFGSPTDFDRLQRSYDEQKGQLATCTGYTNWGDS